MKHLVLHVGMPKTGTTSIQNTLARYQAELGARGCHYPIFERGWSDLDNHSFALMSLYADHPMSLPFNRHAGVDTRQKLARLQTGYRQQLVRALGTAHETVILSGEGMSVLSEPGLRRLWADLRRMGGSRLAVSVVCCTREPNAFAQSAVQEKIKTGQVLTPDLEDAFVADAVDRFASLLSRCSAVFGPSAVDVYSFEDALASRAGLCAFFLGRALPELDWTPPREPRSNESLCHEAVELISFLNARLPVFVDGRPGPHRRSGDVVCLTALDGQRFRLGVPLQRRLTDASRPDRAWLAERFGIDCDDPSVTAVSREALWAESTLAQLRSLSHRFSPAVRQQIAAFLRDRARAVEAHDPGQAARLMRARDAIERLAVAPRRAWAWRRLSDGLKRRRHVLRVRAVRRLRSLLSG